MNWEEVIKELEGEIEVSDVFIQAYRKGNDKLGECCHIQEKYAFKRAIQIIREHLTNKNEKA